MSSTTGFGHPTTRTSGTTGAARPTTGVGHPTTSTIGTAHPTTGATCLTTGTADPVPTAGSDGRDDTGPDRYSASPELRLVLAAIDQTCRFPGCSRRANRCELDHTQDWAHGGTTHPENLTYLCSRHHHLKHDTGWTVQPDPDQPRHLNWRSPHGRQYTTAPPRAPSG
ncbi:HNH endonuclease signature motif containing protein [Herbiconiux sp. P17]|uniref:HNH endonuclease signature motif containing protein n=1 Tax=Herbiconiux wuyangfengii TaxID=3342794 RepID=UPI0035B84B02